VDGQRGVTCGVGDRQECGCSVEAGLNARLFPGAAGARAKGRGGENWSSRLLGSILEVCANAIQLRALVAHRRQESCSLSSAWSQRQDTSHIGMGSRSASCGARCISTTTRLVVLPAQHFWHERMQTYTSQTQPTLVAYADLCSQFIYPICRYITKRSAR
jgi:hypothetical protein